MAGKFKREKKMQLLDRTEVTLTFPSAIPILLSLQIYFSICVGNSGLSKFPFLHRFKNRDINQISVKSLGLTAWKTVY